MSLDHAYDRGSVRRKRRACLCCADPFDSAWAGERICPRCKTSATWRDDLTRNGSNHARYETKSRRKTLG